MDGRPILVPSHHLPHRTRLRLTAAVTAAHPQPSHPSIRDPVIIHPHIRLRPILIPVETSISDPRPRPHSSPSSHPDPIRVAWSAQPPSLPPLIPPAPSIANPDHRRPRPQSLPEPLFPVVATLCPVRTPLNKYLLILDS